MSGNYNFIINHLTRLISLVEISRVLPSTEKLAQKLHSKISAEIKIDRQNRLSPPHLNHLSEQSVFTPIVEKAETR